MCKFFFYVQSWKCQCRFLSFHSLNTLNKETVFVETYPLKRIWENVLISVALVQDIRFETSIQCLRMSIFFVSSRQFDLEPLILTRTNSFLNFQQIFSFTPLLVENSYSFSHQTKQD